MKVKDGSKFKDEIMSMESKSLSFVTSTKAGMVLSNLKPEDYSP
jgi:hypothetical protein